MLVDIINRQCENETVALLVVNNKINEDLLATINKQVKIYCVNRIAGCKYQLLSAYMKINQILKTEKPDVIHCHDNKLLPFFFLNRKKTCLTVHNVNLSCLFMKYYQKVFAISSAVKDDVKCRTGVDSTVVYNGINVDEYETRKNFDLNNKPLKTVLLSRLFPQQKGQHIAIEALSLLAKNDSKMDIQLYFIGTGDALNELKQLAVEKHVENNVIFCGQKDRGWIQKNLKDFHLLIQPSLYEGFGLTVIEGFAAGLPVIASNIDGPEEIFKILNAGLPVEAGNAEDLAEKIKIVYNRYLSDNIQQSNYLITDKNNLKVFDIQTTVDNYSKNISNI
jgi:glycosyltransferase involved in cell wall biosynthesis